MTDELEAPPPAPAFNAANIEKFLIEAQGDLFIASQLLGHVTVMRLDRAIRADERLQNVYLNIKAVKALPEYDRISQEQLEIEIARRMAVYRADGLEALHKLATMDYGENSAMAQVALSAAARLAGGGQERNASASDLENTLRELNDAYHTHAPRLKLTRTTTIELEPPERVVEASPPE